MSYSIILDEKLKDIYFRGIDRKVVAVTNNGGRILYSQSCNEIYEIRKYIRESESLLNGDLFGKSLQAESISKKELNKIFSEFEDNKVEEVEEIELEEKKGEYALKLRGILEKCANDGCSDIHIEVYESKTIFFQRINGDRHEINSVPENQLGLNLAAYIFFHKADEKDEDFFKKRINNGKFEEILKINGIERNTQWRVSWMPSNEGGKIALRWLNKEEKVGSLTDLGWPKSYVKVVQDFVKHGSGALFVSGKVGSGKSTTLASIMENIDPSLSRHSFEDPPEFRLVGVVQTQVRPNVKVSDGSDEYQDQAYFAKGGLRQDIDVELYGETREKAGASQVGRKSETGQLVLSSIHTSGASGIPSTLVEHLELSPSLVSSPDFLKLLVYQALVKSLCSCALPFNEWKNCDEVEVSEVRHAETTLNELIKEGKVGESIFESCRFKNPNGCEMCESRGEKDRLPLIELIVVDDEDREFWFKRDFIGWKKHLIEKGFSDISYHGARRVESGEVDLFTAEKRIGRFVKESTQSVYEGLKHD